MHQQEAEQRVTLFTATGEPHYLGKEVERKRQAGDNLADILMEPPPEYKAKRDQYSVVTKKALHPAVVEKLKDGFSIRKLAKKAKLAASTVAHALQGLPVQPRSWRLLMRVYESVL